MRISGKIKALVATLAIAGSAFGAYVGTASASGEAAMCFKDTGSYSYPNDPSASSPYACYARKSRPTAATIRGTHSWSEVYWYMIWYGSDGLPLSAAQGGPYSAVHYSAGLNWGPGVTIPTAAAYYLPVLYNTSTVGPDAYYPHL